MGTRNNKADKWNLSINESKLWKCWSWEYSLGHNCLVYKNVKELALRVTFRFVKYILLGDLDLKVSRI